MPKRKTTSTATTSVSTAATGHTPATNVKFPELSAKEGLACRVLLEDQVLLIDVRMVPIGVAHDRLSYSFSEPILCRGMQKIRQVH